jgi:hypothetical protein
MKYSSLLLLALAVLVPAAKAQSVDGSLRKTGADLNGGNLDATHEQIHRELKVSLISISLN